MKYKLCKARNSIFVLLTTLFSMQATAAEYNNTGSTGLVKILRVHDQVSIGSESDWIGVEGFTQAGTCLTNSGLVVLRTRDSAQGGDKMFATALAARGIGAKVQVSVDDAVTDAGGYCYLRYIQIDQ